MAEALFHHHLGALHSPIQVSSAGIAALVGRPADPKAQQVLKLKGIDMSAHRARQLTDPMALAADLVLVMEASQKTWLEYKLPSCCGRVHRLGKWSNLDITDPYQGPIAAFDRALALIEQSVNEWQNLIKN